MKKLVFLFVAAFVCVMAAFPPVALASNYPNKPVTVLQGFKAGGGSDTLAQLTQPYLEKIIGQSFVNQYIPGATGAIAWTQLAKTAKKDGYVLSITNTPMLQTNYIMNSDITYTIADLEPIANVITDPGIIVVGKDSPYQTAEDLFKAVRDNPGKITVGNSGVGGDDFFTVLILEKTSGMKFQQIPFEGDGPSWQAAMGGKIDASFNNLGITFPQIQAGNLRALALLAEERYVGLPNVPTVKELGYDVVSGSSRGYSAPKGIPAEAREALVSAFKIMAELPEFKKACDDRASMIDMKLGADYAKMLEEQEKMFKTIWSEVKDQYQGN
ncbi:MAG: tripartite tricarboxylate transporter substrate binding protein [Synergistaceae bacterium]|nr:tripartite tricarboxylate transporter substrate binding protein [Synergistaceae bacterium]